MDRSEISRRMAKVLAYLACGKPDQARYWFEQLIEILNENGLGWSRR